MTSLENSYLCAQTHTENSGLCAQMHTENSDNYDLIHKENSDNCDHTQLENSNHYDLIHIEKLSIKGALILVTRCIKRSLWPIHTENLTWQPVRCDLGDQIHIENSNLFDQIVEISDLWDHMNIETRIPRNAVSRLPALFHKIEVNL